MVILKKANSIIEDKFKKMPAKKIRILVAEDEKPISRALELKLQKDGFDTKAAYDGEEASALLKSEKFDLVILDLMMPKKDGFGVLEDMKTRGDKTPVIVASNLSQSEDMARVAAYGAKDYFIKSDTPVSEVVTYVKEALGL